MSRRRWEPVAGVDTPQALNLLDEQLTLMDKAIRNVEEREATNETVVVTADTSPLLAWVYYLS